MKNLLFSPWKSSSKIAFHVPIIPDGCRDLIVKVVGNQQPQWLISPLFDHTKNVFVEAHSCTHGFRLKPGALINQHSLLHFIKQNNPCPEDIQTQLPAFIKQDTNINEALACLASEATSIKDASWLLGVSTRTLQRHILNKTGKTPGYWFQLARVRKAAKNLSIATSLVELATDYGFSDQPHMNKEFNRWFNATPSQLINLPNIMAQLNSNGYA